MARADALGAASLGDPEGAELMRAARAQERPARWRRGAGWAQLDRELERAVRRAARSRYRVRGPVRPMPIMTAHASVVWPVTRAVVPRDRPAARQASR